MIILNIICSKKWVMWITILEQRKKSFKKFPHSRNCVEISKTFSFFVQACYITFVITAICQSRAFFIFASCMFFVGNWLACPTLPRWTSTWRIISVGQGLLLIAVLIDEPLKNLIEKHLLYCDSWTSLGQRVFIASFWCSLHKFLSSFGL